MNKISEVLDNFCIIAYFNFGSILSYHSSSDDIEDRNTSLINLNKTALIRFNFFNLIISFFVIFPHLILGYAF